MGYETNADGLIRHYGPREAGEYSIGGQKNGDGYLEAVIYCDADNQSMAEASLPKNAIVDKVVAKVVEDITVGGADTTIIVGTDGSEATNGATAITGPQSAGYVAETSTLNGTWAAPLAAATTVGLAIGGTVATWTAGKIEIHIFYRVV